MLDFSQVVTIIKAGPSKDIIEARKYSDKVNMHITGRKASEFLETLENYENVKQKELRDKLLTSNKGLFTFLLRPIDNVFTAKGGRINYNLTDEKKARLVNLISNVNDKLDLKTYLRKKILSKYIIDPNGFILLDLDAEGQISTEVHTTHDILHYDKKGNSIEGIIFEANGSYKTDEKDNKKYYRVLDKDQDNIYIQDGESVTLSETRSFPNFWGYVPAMILGDEYDPNSNMFVSFIDGVLEEAQNRFRDLSIATVHKLSHGYPKYWQYPEACTKCAGIGEVSGYLDGSLTKVVCSSCEGGGVKQRKDPSDVMIIDLPKDGEHNITPHVAGVVSPDGVTMKIYRDELKELKEEMFNSLWGSPFESNMRIETATATILGRQAEENRLGRVSTTFARLHKFMLDAFGQFVFLSSEYESSVSYGRRYLLETANEILDTFETASKNGLPEILQKDLIEKYYESEFSENDLEYVKRKKLLAVDPFPFQSASAVKDLGVSEEDLKLKIYYPQWTNQVEEAKIVFMSIDQLKAELANYIRTKTIQDGQKQE